MVKQVLIAALASLASFGCAGILTSIASGQFNTSFFPSLIFFILFFIIIDWLFLRGVFNTGTSSEEIRKDLKIILITIGVSLIGWILIIFCSMIYLLGHMGAG